MGKVPEIAMSPFRGDALNHGLQQLQLDHQTCGAYVRSACVVYRSRSYRPLRSSSSLPESQKRLSHPMLPSQSGL